MIKPVNSPITSHFGVQRVYTVNGVTYRDTHNGADFGSPMNTDVVAPESGYASFLWDSTGGGNMVIINGKTGKHFLLHNNRFIGGNRYVNEGEIVAKSGMSGRATGAHVHWGLKRNGQWVNPLSFLNNNPQTNTNMETYLAQPGDTLSGISSRFGVSQDEIVRLNPGKIIFRADGDRWIKAGEIYTLKPKQVTPAPTPKPNDTIRELEEKHNAEIAKLKDQYDKRVFELEVLKGEEAKKLQDAQNTIMEYEAEIQKIKESARVRFNIDIEDFGISGVEREIIRESRVEIVKSLFIQVSKFYEFFPKPFRPVIYLGTGLLFTALSLFLTNIDIQAIIATNPDASYTAILGVVASSGLFNQLIYLLKTLGDKFRLESVELIE